jgi:glycosyltransferase involved in cell wall biosynthesis
VSHLANELVAIGCDVDVLTQCPRQKVREWTSEEQGSEVRVYRFGDWTGTRQFRVAPGIWRFLWQYGGAYDVIHAHNFHAFPAFAASVSTTRPFVFSPHYHRVGHTAAARALHLPYDKFARHIFDRAAYILCVSDAEQDLIASDFPASEARIRKVGIGIDLSAIQQALPFEVERPIVLAAGRLESYKNVESIVDAFAHYSGNARLVIAGDGPERGSIQHRIHRLDMADRVDLLGHVSEVDIRRWQRTAKVAVSLSSSEAFGLGVAEAVASGSRVVASDIPAHREMADRSQGVIELLPNNATSADIVDALNRALSAPSDLDSPLMLQTWQEVAQRSFDVYCEAERGSRK